ncbi:MAG TPA: winged helix-turn-helix domain-containing protein [Terriglobales bacterium]|nr:winged helix-turn-helix domain-containing protein [Terriglobales bacterium]
MTRSLGLRELGKYLGRLLRATTQRKQSELVQTGDFRIDLESHRVTVRDHEVRLSPEEFDLLVFLLGHPKRVVTPRTQLRTRWGGQQTQHAGFLRVLLSLRNKLGVADDGTHYIRTEPWVFYRFAPRAT